ncbi:MAG: hypothetical protein AAGA29_02720 [Planctomycetota bacterium]
MMRSPVGSRGAVFGLLSLCCAWLVGPAWAQSPETQREDRLAQGVTDEQLRAHAEASYLSALEAYAQTEWAEAPDASIRTRIILGLIACDAREQAATLIDALDPDARTSLIDRLAREYGGDARLRRPFVVDLLADTPNDLLRISRLIMCSRPTNNYPPCEATAHALALLVQAVETTDLPEQSAAADPREPRTMSYPGRVGVYRYLIDHLAKHREHEQAAEAFTHLPPGTQAWSEALRIRVNYAVDIRPAILRQAFGALDEAGIGLEHLDAVLEIASLQVKHGDAPGASATLARALEAVADQAAQGADPVAAVRWYAAVAERYLAADAEREAAAVLSAGLAVAQQVEAVDRRDGLVYQLIRPCLTGGCPGLAAGLVEAISTPARALPPARNRVVAYLIANDAAGARSAYDAALALAEAMEGPDAQRARQELEREFEPWLAKAEAGEPFPQTPEPQAVAREVVRLADAGRADEIRPYFQTLGFDDAEQMRYLTHALQWLGARTRSAKRARPLLLTQHAIALSADPDTPAPAPGQPRVASTPPAMYGLDAPFVPSTAPTIGPPTLGAVDVMGEPGRAQLLSALFRVTRDERADYQRIQWLAGIMTRQLRLGLTDDAFAVFASIEDDTLACTAGMLAAASAYHFAPEDIAARLARAVAERAAPLDEPLRKLVLLAAGAPAPGNAAIDRRLRERIRTLGATYGGTGIGGSFGEHDPLDARYLAAYEQGMLGNEQEFADALDALREEDDRLADPFERARTLRMVAGLEAAFGDEDGARDTLAQALAAYLAYTEGFDAPDVQPPLFLTHQRLAVLEDLIEWHAQLQREIDEAVAAALIQRYLALMDGQRPSSWIEMAWYAELSSLATDAGRAEETQRLYLQGIERAMLVGRHASTYLDALLAGLIDAGRSPAALWEEVGALPDPDGTARRRVRERLGPMLVLHDPEAWGQSIETIEPATDRVQLYLDGGDVLLRVYQRRLVRHRR